MRKPSHSRIFAVIVFVLVPTVLSLRIGTARWGLRDGTLTATVYYVGLPRPALIFTHLRYPGDLTNEEWCGDPEDQESGFHFRPGAAGLHLLICSLLILPAFLLPRALAAQVAVSVLLGIACGIIANLLHSIRFPSQGGVSTVPLIFMVTVPPPVILLLSLRARRPFVSIVLHSSICAALMYPTLVWVDQLMTRQIMAKPSIEELVVGLTVAIVLTVLSLLVWPALRALGVTKRFRGTALRETTEELGPVPESEEKP